jgi:N-methylhydantoinase B
MMAATDPVLDEVIQSALDMAVEEGGLAAARAAGSTFISTSTVISCALFDPGGRQVAQTAGGLLHVSALRVMLPELLKRHPAADFREGDVYIFNDHFLGGIHPTDVGAFRPIFMTAGSPISPRR